MRVCVGHALVINFLLLRPFITSSKSCPCCKYRRDHVMMKFEQKVFLSQSTVMSESDAQGHHQLSRAISHYIWFGLNEGYNDEDLESSSMYCNLPLVEWPMRNIETCPSQQMYLYLSLVKRKVTEFYHNIDRRPYLVWLK